MNDHRATDQRAAAEIPAAELEARFLAACELAEQAGTLLLGHFRGELETHIKERDSAVSNADQAAEAMLRAEIARRFPDDSVLGEEQALEARGGAWCWTLDPLDGTHNFVAGMSEFTVAIGALHGRQPAIGVILDPCRGEIYAAARGRGTRRNGTALQVTDRPFDRMAMLAIRHRFMRGPRAVLLDLLPTRKHRCLGSICLEMAYVAAGAFHAAVAGSARIWEAVPGAVLIEEAGGVVRDLVGGPIFPLADSPAVYAKHRFRMLGGPAPVVEELAACMRQIPL
jgi:myo-inositol-1(or 4)-monophosphatase